MPEKVKIPKNITPEEFFLSFVPSTYNKRVNGYDMSSYKKLNWRLQFNIAGLDEGEFGIVMSGGNKLESFKGKIPDPQVTYSFDLKHFGEARDGQLPWVPLDAMCDPQALQDLLPPAQAEEQMAILKGTHGQAIVRVKRNDGAQTAVQINFHNASQPQVVFDVNQSVVEEIERKEKTVMEAFMAGKIKLQGPVEFAMHVMALIPEPEEEE